MCICTVWGGGGGGLKTSQYLVWPPFVSRSQTHLLRIELLRLLIVACGMLVHFSSMAVRSCPQHTPAHTITPPPPWATRSTMLTSANCSPTRHHTCWLPSALYSENRDSSVKRAPLQSARRHRMWVFAHSSRLRRQTAVRSRPLNMVEKLTFNSRATALVDIPAVSMPIARSLKTCDICGIVRCDKTALEWPFIVATCAIIMLSNQHLDMPHLWGGWIISAKEKWS